MARERFIPVAEAARLKGCSRQAIHAAIQAERLTAKTKAVKGVVWLVGEKSLAKLVINPKMKRNGRPRKSPTRYCEGCEASLTSTDLQAGECTQCHNKL
jgi:uncharacterized paraquat-inducible protein A